MDETQIPNPYGAAQQDFGAPQPTAAQKPKGFAITALVLGIISIVGFCCCLNVITAPLAIIFGIIALVKHQGGTGLSITGLILAALSVVVTLSMLAPIRDFYPYLDVIIADYQEICEHQNEVFPAYEEDQTLPECLEKYKEPPYSELLEKYDINIYDIMDALLIEYQQGTLPPVPVEGSTQELCVPPIASPQIP